MGFKMKRGRLHYSTTMKRLKSNIPGDIKKHNSVGIKYKHSFGKPYDKIKTNLTKIDLDKGY